MIKILGIVIITFAVASIGFFKSFELKGKVTALQQLCLLIGEIKYKISYSKDSINSILRELLICDKYLQLSFLKGINSCGDADDLEPILRFIMITDWLNNDQKNLLVKFMCGLGKSDSESQISHCESYLEIFRNEQQTIKSDAEQKTKLYRSLSMFGAAFIAIMLI